MAIFNWMNESDFDLDRLEDRRSGQEVCKRGQAAALPWAVWTGFPSLKM